MLVFAYLDPGTGSLVMQAIVAGAAGVAILWKTTTRRLLRRGRQEEEPASEQSPSAEEPAAGPSPD